MVRLVRTSTHSGPAGHSETIIAGWRAKRKRLRVYARMGSMPGMEDFLPTELQFDTSVEKKSDSLVGELYDALIEGRDIIDFHKELSRQDELRRISRKVTYLITIPGEDYGEVQRVVHRSVAFVLQAIEEILATPIETPPTEYLGEASDADGAPITIAEEVETYLSSRQNIANLIFTFRGELDASYEYHHHVQTASGLLFMLFERGIAEKYMQTQLNNFNISALEQGEI